MTLMSDAKFEEELTLGSKNGMWNLVDFNASTGKSKNFHFDVSFKLEPVKWKAVLLTTLVLQD